MDQRYEHFTVLISKINRCIKKIKNIEMIEYNLKGNHVSVLYYLHVYNALTAKELCEKCEEDKGTISRTINYLEENKFIYSPCQNKKRYNSQFLLTEKGKEIAKEIEIKTNDLFEKVSNYLNKEERENLYAYLFKLSTNLENLHHEKE